MDFPKLILYVRLTVGKVFEKNFDVQYFKPLEWRIDSLGKDLCAQNIPSKAHEGRYVSPHQRRERVMDFGKSKIP